MYRLAMHVTKGGLKGRTLRAIANGIQVSKRGKIDATEAAEDIVAMSKAIHDNDQFTSYGIIAVLCEETGNVVTAQPLR